MKVRSLVDEGFYDHKGVVSEGEEFELVSDSHFSPGWMEKVKATRKVKAKTEEKAEATTEEADKGE